MSGVLAASALSAWCTLVGFALGRWVFPSVPAPDEPPAPGPAAGPQPPAAPAPGPFCACPHGGCPYGNGSASIVFHDTGITVFRDHARHTETVKIPPVGDQQLREALGDWGAP